MGSGVRLCEDNVVQVRASKAKELKELLKQNPGNITLQEEEAFIEEICDHNEEKKENAANNEALGGNITVLDQN